MARRVEASRSYQSPVRQEQVENTRRRVIEAAHRLFVERGYTGTIVAAVAAEAGVSPETIYGSLGGKRGLLERVIEASIEGPDAPVPFEQRAAFAEIVNLGTPPERLHAIVDYVCGILARTSPVHAVIRGAADGEPFAVDLRERLLQDRLARFALLIRACFAGALRPRLTVQRASERLGALLSPELYHLLTVELGWTPLKYKAWVSAVVEADLLR